jgi:hypothetical protein
MCSIGINLSFVAKGCAILQQKSKLLDDKIFYCHEYLLLSRHCIFIVKCWSVLQQKTKSLHNKKLYCHKNHILPWSVFYAKIIIVLPQKIWLMLQKVNLLLRMTLFLNLINPAQPKAKTKSAVTWWTVMLKTCLRTLINFRIYYKF